MATRPKTSIATWIARLGWGAFSLIAILIVMVFIHGVGYKDGLQDGTRGDLYIATDDRVEEWVATRVDTVADGALRVVTARSLVTMERFLAVIDAHGHLLIVKEIP